MLFSVQPNSHFDNSVSALTITGSGQLDLANNHLFINYGSGADPKASIVAWIKSGFAAGSWNGAGIISTSAPTRMSGHYGLGFADSTDAGNPAGLASSGQIEIKYTLLGDANLDGTVNVADFNALAAHFNSTSQLWSSGDFNYDGIVNAEDFDAIARNYGQVMSSPALGTLGSGDLGRAVPEPTALAALGVVVSLGRRRRARERFGCHS